MSRFFTNGEELTKISDLTNLFHGNFKDIKQFNAGNCLDAPLGLSAWVSDSNSILNSPNDEGDWFGLIKWSIAGQYLYLALANHQNIRYRLYARWTTGSWFKIADSQNGGVTSLPYAYWHKALTTSTEMEVA